MSGPPPKLERSNSANERRLKDSEARIGHVEAELSKLSTGISSLESLLRRSIDDSAASAKDAMRRNGALNAERATNGERTGVPDGSGPANSTDEDELHLGSGPDDLRATPSQRVSQVSPQTTNPAAGKENLSAYAMFPLVPRPVIAAILDGTLSPADLIKCHPDAELVRRASTESTQLEARDGKIVTSVRDATTKIFPSLAVLLQCLLVYFAIYLYSVPTIVVGRIVAGQFSEYLGHLLRFDALYKWPAVLSYHVDFFRFMLRTQQENGIGRWDLIDQATASRHLYIPSAARSAPSVQNPPRASHTVASSSSSSSSSSPAHFGRASKVPATAENPFGLSEAERLQNATTICKNFQLGSCPNTPCPSFRQHVART